MHQQIFEMKSLPLHQSRIQCRTLVSDSRPNVGVDDFRVGEQMYYKVSRSRSVVREPMAELNVMTLKCNSTGKFNN